MVFRGYKELFLKDNLQENIKGELIKTIRFR